MGIAKRVVALLGAAIADRLSSMLRSASQWPVTSHPSAPAGLFLRNATSVRCARIARVFARGLRFV